MHLDREHNPYGTGNILGQDDWLFYWRCGCGRLLYTVVELTGYWLGAPHKGIREGCDCPDPEDFSVCKVDKSWMHLFVGNNPDKFTWRNVPDDMRSLWINGTEYDWTPANDYLFMAHSRKHHLID